jgi:NAD-dependent SIR2 family protein deacetylase
VPSTPTKNRLSFEDYFPSSQSSSVSTSNRRSSTSPNSKLKGQDLFDAAVWRTAHTTEVFHRFIASLRQKVREEVKETSLTHKFIRTLKDGGRLMRCYTQNIDGLERREGLSMDLHHGKGTRKRFMKKIWEAPRPAETRNSDADGGCEVVPLHGDLEVLRCTLCQETFPWSEDLTEIFLDGLAPKCSKCAMKSCDRQERGKRSVAVGSLRPNIVLYGEEHPSNQLLAPLIPFDIASGPEILIIMGTSLKVHGLQKVVREFAKKIHARKDGKGKVICVNRTKPAESVWENVIDHYIAMDCDDWVRDLRTRREDLWLRQGELNLSVTKPSAKKRKSTDGTEVPSKRAKIVIEIPAKRRNPTATPWVNEVVRETPDSALLTPPPSRGKGSKLDAGALIPEPTTSGCPRNISFKRTMFDSMFKSIFGSPVRPEPYPLRNTWKPSIMLEEGNSSPERPQVFSPIDERHANWKVHEDLDVEIAESQDEEQEEATGFPNTPTKARVLRPSSDSTLNLDMIREWSTEARKASLLGKDDVGHMLTK